MATTSLRFPHRPDFSSSFTLSSPRQQSRRYSAMPSPFLDKIKEGEVRRSTDRSSIASSSSLARKMSFMTTSTPSRTSTLVTISTLKSRLVRKRPSAPILSKPQTTSPVEWSPEGSPTTPTGTDVQGPYSYAIGAPSGSRSRTVGRQASTSSSLSRSRQTPRQIRHVASIERVLTSENDVRTFRELDWMKHRQGMSLHPYGKEDAPYMQGYNPTLLLNELYTHHLLRRLNTHGGPSFLDYGTSPPDHVLDLGCGRGTWAVEAAKEWGPFGTRVVGLDLVDVLSDQAKACEYFDFQRGNFVKYQLPFPSDSFGMVRIANAGLSIPQDRWKFVLKEVMRVLVPGGRVEIIDDEMVFPYSNGSMSQPQSTRSSWGSGKSTYSRTSSGQSISTGPSDDTQDSFLDMGFDVEDNGPPTPGLYHGSSPSETSCEDLYTPTDETPSTYPWSSGELGPNGSRPQSLDQRSIDVCREVEQTFESMLQSTYGIHINPHQELKTILTKVFTPSGNVREMRVFNLSLAEVPVSNNKGRSEVESIRRLNREQLAQAQQEGKLTTKAARLLGVAVEKNLAATRSPVPSVRTIGSLNSLGILEKTEQPRSQRGLFVAPNQFLETTERELDMYSSKNIHTLLGCRVALSKFVRANAVEPSNSTANDVLQEMLWEYERTRRRRLGLPELRAWLDQGDELPVDPLTTDVKRPKYLTPSELSETFASTVDKGHSPHGPLVRCIRVFEAFKPYGLSDN